jgi:hypothetical protein
MIFREPVAARDAFLIAFASAAAASCATVGAGACAGPAPSSTPQCCTADISQSRRPSRAHLDHMAAVDLALADRTADTEARLAIQGQTVADLDRRTAQIDAAIEASTRLGRPVGAITISDQRRRERADIVAERQREAQALASLQIEKAKIEAQLRRVEADVGPVRYLAELMGITATDLERPVRLLTLALVAVLDPMAVVLLLAAGIHTTRAGSR